jgi:hypothetical protein
MKRARIVIVLVLVVVLGCLMICIFRSNEPCYQGRPLSKWLEEGGAALNPSLRVFENEPQMDPGKALQSAREAVDHIGTNAIPFLLKWAHVKNSPFKTKMADWFARHPSFHVRIWRTYYYHVMADVGFIFLGDKAKPAWPTLIQWTSDTDPERRYLALCYLMVTRPDRATILPVLQRALQDPYKPIRLEAADGIHYLELQDTESATNKPATK